MAGSRKSSTEPVSEKSISEIETNLPPNTPEEPEPTIFRVSPQDSKEHSTHIRTFPPNKDIKGPVIKPFSDLKKINDDGDEYVQIRTDPKGEAKITENGYLLDGRKFLITTFTLPGRGKKLYALGTEAARIANSRDAFMFFLRNKQIFRANSTDEERKFFEKSGFHIPKNRSRPVAIVTARSLFKQFGAKVILSGKRVIDDYFENDVTSQGFTSEDQVFPVEATKIKKLKPLKDQTKLKADQKVDIKTKLKISSGFLVSPLPSWEDRREYLAASSSGSVTQVLPGQGITGGLELASVSSIPRYRHDGHSTVKHKHLLSSLETSTPVPNQLPINTSIQQLPINDALAGKTSQSGLVYFNNNITKRIASIDSNDLNEIEYLHSTVEVNKYINLSRAPRRKQWGYYWQAKSGTRLGLSKEETSDFLKSNEALLSETQEETRFNEYLQCNQVITKKRRPNPNFLGHGNITGHKPPYAEKPTVEPEQNVNPQFID